ncbi:unnamed protein product [Anisakis simplex]|uniref:Inorganic diphosphatase n=1 Tax=Anisakis simplex TaxID=6269 RepID=A0A0M3JBL6_ANISI|nr:unnamed protein product [Anisakis simplex]
MIGLDNDAIFKKKDIPAENAPKAPRVGGMVGTFDPNYQVIFFFEVVREDSDPVVEDHKNTTKLNLFLECSAPHYQPYHRTLAGLNNNDIFKVKNAGPRPPDFKPPPGKAIAGTYDPNYQTLAGLNNDEIFKQKQCFEPVGVTPPEPLLRSKF